MPLVIHGLKGYRAFTFIFTLGKQSPSRDIKVSRNSLKARFESLDVFNVSRLITRSHSLSDCIEVSKIRL